MLWTSLSLAANVFYIKFISHKVGKKTKKQKKWQEKRKKKEKMIWALTKGVTHYRMGLNHN